METILIGENDVRRVHEQTALDDHDVMLDPGTYPLRYATVDGRPATPGSAYWVLSAIPCTRLHNGARFGVAGDRKAYHLQMRAYAVAGKAATS